jgi:hypothetical protein
MDDTDPLISPEIQDGRALLAKKIASFGLIISMVLSLIAVGSIVSSNSNDSDSSGSSVSQNYIDEFESVYGDTSWIPAGYDVWENDSSVAWKYSDNSDYECDNYACLQVEVIAQTGCPNSLYAALNWLDSGGSVIAYDNASLPSLRSMQVAKLKFDDVAGSSDKGQLAEINCR